MKTTGLNLLIPEKSDLEREAMAEAFVRQGGAVHRIGRFWDPPAFDPATVRVYGRDSHCAPTGAQCASPASCVCRKREIENWIPWSLTFPAFIKPVMPKQFRGAVFSAANAVAAECRGLPPGTAIFVSEPVKFTAEVRSFALNGLVLDAAAYEGDARVADAVAFVTALAKALPLPHAIVVDVGYIAGRGWAVIEFNAAWGAGLNRCNSEKVLPTIVAASAPRGESV